jgi:phenylalanyl-tRNA synthetase beta chain
MRISLAWLRDHLEGSTPAAELAARLTAAGMNVELREPSGNDEAWDVDVTGNRPDAMNHRGLAREAAAAGCGTLKPLEPAVKEGQTAVTSLAKLAVEDTGGCPRYCFRVIRGVKIGPSPPWLAERLERCGIRSINNVVDATNYVLLDVGHPLHAFDLALLGGHEIRVRRARTGERITTLDGVERQLTTEDLVIADATHPVALAGIMGGAESEISAKTTDLLLESAYFDPFTVRRAARRLGMSTEASHRFERGGDRAMARIAVDLAAALIVTLAGGEVAAGVLDSAPTLPAARTIPLSLQRLSAFAGCAIPREQALAVLADLDLAPRAVGDAVTCTVPPHRVDLELAEDLYEEVLRHFGYDNVPSVLPATSAEPGARLGTWPLTERGRDALVAAGLAEAVTYSFVAVEADVATASSPLAARGDAVVLANPLSARMAVMRRTILAGLTEAAAGNLRRGAESVLLGEVGRVFFADGQKVREEERLAVVVAGRLGPWDDPRTTDFWDLKGVLETVLQNLGVRGASWRPAAVGVLAADAGAEVVVDGRVVAVAGRLADALAALVDAPAPLWVAEVDLACAGAPAVPIFQAIPRFPPVIADLTIRHALALSYAELDAAIRSAAPSWLEDVQPVVRYQGVGVGAGEVKTTLRLVYRMGERSLTQEEVNAAHFALMDALAARLGVSFQ